MKSKRQERILELISQFEIDTQEELMGKLRDEGFKVTQATVSRDLRDLKLTKAMTTRGTYRYTVGPGSNPMGNVKLNSAMIDSITNVDHSMNTVVVKTYPGLAQAVASGIDSMNIHTVLGSVAGDDTIIIVTRDEVCSEELSERLRELMKNM